LYCSEPCFVSIALLHQHQIRSRSAPSLLLSNLVLRDIPLDPIFSLRRPNPTLSRYEDALENRRSVVMLDVPNILPTCSDKEEKSIDEALLTKIYYRLYRRKEGPLPSVFPLFEDDPSLSFIHLEHISPPCLAANFIRSICIQENIHPSRVKAYTPPSLTAVPDSESRILTRRDAVISRDVGFSVRRPLLVRVEFLSGEERPHITAPLPSWLIAGRAVGSGIVVTTYWCWRGLRTIYDIREPK